ncbi:hypothetical protein Pint_03586 [Pistacia integerrima]|uniref:Uncharacterized protein n=1 Tax=Pistacia integerrima TaxID=434235 RepID=A0ACC0Z5Q4_9ROSI|nr:hypothetical protein Pint_03586 [Pistacia integerrima]
MLLAMISPKHKHTQPKQLYRSTYRESSTKQQYKCKQC